MIISSQGDLEILNLPKTAFLCSREIPSAAVLRCFDWAVEQREKQRCVIGGFHSGIEQDVFHFLLAGTQPIILALARGMKRRREPALQGALDSGRLLIVTPFEDGITRVTQKTAEKRNRVMIALADEIVIGFSANGGMLANLINEVRGKQVTRL